MTEILQELTTLKSELMNAIAKLWVLSARLVYPHGARVTCPVCERGRTWGLSEVEGWASAGVPTCCGGVMPHLLPAARPATRKSNRRRLFRCRPPADKANGRLHRRSSGTKP